ncbi:hypothetical protein UFOVP1157_57 [uncultured Caudovirales phage]|uniref:Uncharacterized protein n=1 Tax=uncultured Caudovirales phage TaxID=2100421 RepID=A0A6J5Q8U4_9CAUD|nr:hypothetical protein UFOVP497_38 [uncultured Caudovirales phage]CAB4164289.1 hypothetical protein UFOVP834_14 [uncultured Caudovirales phage]CAB4172400.1 hypothetical protein UFOVP922_57 [uncultured Caudovirales phage]CAB4177775.1 hypothetical protein UFOVP1006_50 [uncultured Caudovirales phage]CAB4183980.1 hypothetical protein UFOVP1096_30 [uncultured Caudovirales phage]
MHNGHDARTQAVIAHAKPKANTHTREVTRETLPEDVQTLLLEMADEIRTLRTKVFELDKIVGAFGSVTLNDLMKKSA